MKIETPKTDAAEFTVSYGDARRGRKAVSSDFARKLEHKLNLANDKITALIMLCAENGINVKSITVAAMPNDQKLSHAAGDIRQPETRSENCQA